jgi:hypothetical protein
MAWLDTPCTAFEGGSCIAAGALRDVAMRAKMAVDAGADSASPASVWVFDDATGETLELDWRGTVEEFAVRLVQQAQAVDASAEPAPLPAGDSPASQAPRGPGRPKLGVVAREVTLLPRHWEWLATQPGGASVALRKLVEVARLASERKDAVARCSAVGYKFMSTIAGDAPGFEEASRALFAGDAAGFAGRIAGWPTDVQTHLQKLVCAAFADTDPEQLPS